MWRLGIACALAGCHVVFGLDPIADPSDATIQGDADDSFDAAPVDANRVFMTSSKIIPGNLGGLPGADAECMTRANAIGLEGTFVAWLSTSTVDAKTRLAGARGWVRVDGRPVADTMQDLIAGHVLYPIALDEKGVSFTTSFDRIATATRPDGRYAGAACTNFTVPTMGELIDTGVPQGSTDDWTAFNGQPVCDMPVRLYCFGIDRDVPIPSIPVSGRRAFLSNIWTPGGGLANADNLCKNDALAAGLSGTFRALLATTTAPASSRFSTTGPTWVRPDGVALATSAAAFMSGALLASPNVTAAGTYLSAFVYTGAVDPNTLGISTQTCGDWGNASMALSGHTGFASRADHQFFDGISISCNSQGRVYCLEQ